MEVQAYLDRISSPCGSAALNVLLLLFLLLFLKCRDSENYFGFSVDVFSELVQTVNKSLGCRNLEKYLSYAQNTDP